MNTPINTTQQITTATTPTVVYTKTEKTSTGIIASDNTQKSMPATENLTTDKSVYARNPSPIDIDAAIKEADIETVTKLIPTILTKESFDSYLSLAREIYRGFYDSMGIAESVLKTFQKPLEKYDGREFQIDQDRATELHGKTISKMQDIITLLEESSKTSVR